MQELSRGSIILPIVLRCFLKEDHIKAGLRPALEMIAHDYFAPTEFSCNYKAVEWLITASWVFAQSLLHICGPYSIERRETMVQAVLDGRKALQFICRACAGGASQRYGKTGNIYQ